MTDSQDREIATDDSGAAQEQSGGSAPARQFVTAFLIGVHPDGTPELVAGEQLLQPFTVQRTPTSADIVGLCSAITNYVSTQSTAEMVMQTLMQLQQQAMSGLAVPQNSGLVVP